MKTVAERTWRRSRGRGPEFPSRALPGANPTPSIGSEGLPPFRERPLIWHSFGLFFP